MLTLFGCGDPGGGVSGASTVAAETGEGSSGPASVTTTRPAATTGDPPATTSLPETGEGPASTTGEPAPPTVEVSHLRELRAVWIATVANINFPSKQGLAAAQQQAELVAMLDVARAVGLNAVVFQVRPECDALYASELEPWSRYLTGTQGQDPGYDPLSFLLTEAHARGLEVHAWLNPYRAKANSASALAESHIASVLPQYAYVYDKTLWMDPGAKEVQDHLVAVIADLVGRYDLDGIHFDDYFYPYPSGQDFPDDSTWDAYVEGGGQLDRADWRRDNVNRMVEAVGETVAELRPHVRFGISPFGIYRPGIPPGIQGLDQYEALYADPLKWMQEGWLDYLAPQLYWPTTQAPQSYTTLIEWWSSIAEGGRYIFAGNYLSKLGSDAAWSVDEFRAQITQSREHHPLGSQGNIFFQIAPLMANTQGIADVLRDEFYAEPALTPPLAALADVPVAPPTATVTGTSVSLAHAAPETLRAWVVYAQLDAGWRVSQIVPAAQASVELSPGTWAISAAGRHGVESPGALVTIP